MILSFYVEIIVCISPSQETLKTYLRQIELVCHWERLLVVQYLTGYASVETGLVYNNTAYFMYYIKSLLRLYQYSGKRFCPAMGRCWIKNLFQALPKIMRPFETRKPQTSYELRESCAYETLVLTTDIKWWSPSRHAGRHARARNCSLSTDLLVQYIKKYK